jgi:ATP-dependent helicase/nuclease subunit A
VTQLPESPKSFIIYRSSAGSGKTYTLAREYILLALQFPSYFRHILAVTFTNKATAEMKARIIQNLDMLRKGGGKGLRAEIRDALGITDQQLSKKADDSLAAILHDYSHFNVSTIDKFFQRVLRAFAREVGIQGGVTLELDQEKVLDEIIDRMLLEVGDNPQLTRWLTQFAEDKLQQGKSWDIRKDIRSLGRELFKERFKVVAPVLAEVAKDDNRVQLFMKGMQELQAVFENTVKGFIAKFDKVLEEHRLTVDDFSKKGSGPAGLFAKFAKKEYEISDTRRGATDSLDAWITKTSKIRPQLEQALEGGILTAYNGMIDYHDRNILAYNSASQVMRYLYTLGIISDLSRNLADYRDEEEVMLISDAPDFLNRIIGDNETPYIYEKAGTFYRHYLIDEFQDTSGFQWKNFRPLVENSLAQGYKNLVVGDVKQSIYRWRGGDSQLLLDQVANDIGDVYTQAEQLQNNWRSYANIINFNNKLFELAPNFLADLLLDGPSSIPEPAMQARVEKELERFRQSYHEAAQGQGNENKIGGLIKLQWFESDNPDNSDEVDEETGSWDEKAIQEAIATIEDLQPKYALRDICILVRRAEEGRKIAKALLEKKETTTGKKRYDVISPESLYLGASPVVRLLLSSFSHLYNPKNNLALAQLVYEYHHFLTKKAVPGLSELFIWAGNKEKQAEFEQLLPADFIKELPALLKVPLLELTERLIGLFGLTNYHREFPYLQGFQDALLEYSKNNRGDVGSFLQWWADTGSRRSVQVPEEQDAIRIMTIHKAKGLEFKAVLVPFCSWDFDHKLEEVLWCEAPAIPPFDRLPYYPVRYSSKLIATYFAEAYYEEKKQIYLDNLNLLYVALTRPEEALYIYAPLPKFNKSGGFSINKVSDLLYKLFLDESTEDFAITPAPEIDAASYSVQIGGLPLYDDEQIGDRQPTVGLKSYLSTNWRNRLSIRLQGGTLDEGVREKSLISTQRGTVYHRLLSHIKHQDDLPKVLTDLLPLEPMDKQEQEGIKERLENLFDLPEMKGWYGGEWEVRTESPVLPMSGDIRRFDRVLLKNNEAVLIEFKTGMPSNSHVRQAKEYMSLLSGMGYAKVRGFLVYIDELKINQVA